MSQAISSLLKATVAARMTLSLILRSEKPKKSNGDIVLNDRYLVFVVRLYKEAGSVNSMLRRYSCILNSNKGTFLVLACSDEEKKDTPWGCTADIVRETIKRDEFKDIRDKCYLFEAPGEPNIARQCNYAMRMFLSESRLDPTATWMKTMDVDTELNGSALDELITSINSNSPIVEIAAEYTANYQKLGLPQRWHAAYQDFWSLDFEQFHGLIKNRWQSVYAPVSGAGGTFRMDILEKLGGLPEYAAAEDLALSSKIDQEKIPITTLHSRVESDVPTNFREGFRQEVRWAEGSIDASVLSFHNIQLHEKHAISPTLHTILSNAVWAGISPVVVTGIIHLLAKRNTLFVFCAATLTACYTAHFVRLERNIGSPVAIVLIRSLYAPVQMLRISLPWWIAAGRKILSISESGNIRKSIHE